MPTQNANNSSACSTRKLNMPCNAGNTYVAAQFRIAMNVGYILVYQRFLKKSIALGRLISNQSRNAPNVSSHTNFISVNFKDKSFIGNVVINNLNLALTLFKNSCILFSIPLILFCISS